MPDVAQLGSQKDVLYARRWKFSSGRFHALAAERLVEDTIWGTCTSELSIQYIISHHIWLYCINLVLHGILWILLERATRDSYSYSKLYCVQYLSLMFTFCFPSLVPVGRLRVSMISCFVFVSPYSFMFQLILSSFNRL